MEIYLRPKDMDLSLSPSSSHTPVVIHQQYESSSIGYLQKTTSRHLLFHSPGSRSQHFSLYYCLKWSPCVYLCTFPILHITIRVNFLKHTSTLDHVTPLLEHPNGSHLTQRKMPSFYISPHVWPYLANHASLSLIRVSFTLFWIGPFPAASYFKNIGN